MPFADLEVYYLEKQLYLLSFYSFVSHPFPPTLWTVALPHRVVFQMLSSFLERRENLGKQAKKTLKQGKQTNKQQTPPTFRRPTIFKGKETNRLPPPSSFDWEFFLEPTCVE